MVATGLGIPAPELLDKPFLDGVDSAYVGGWRSLPEFEEAVDRPGSCIMKVHRLNTQMPIALTDKEEQ